MSAIHLFARSIACSLFVVLTASGCFEPDIPALTEKLRAECEVTPPAPSCSMGDPEASDYAYEWWLIERVDSQAEQDCLLAVECGPDADVQEAASACLNLEAKLNLEQPPEPGCALECDDTLLSCGGEEPCGVDVTRECLQENDACRAACPPA